VSATLVDVRTPAPKAPAGLVSGYTSVTLEVSDPARSREFYGELLGLPERLVALAAVPSPRALPDSGAHFAFRVPDLEGSLARLRAGGVEVHDYHEDRPAERRQNCYCLDPDGNRLQLIAGPEPAIDHAALEVHDLEWAEAYYTHVLGGVLEDRVGWKMDDYTSAAEWGEGRERCAPGARRWDRRYTTIEGNARVARPNAHFFVRFGPDVVLGVYLATEHRQEPPPDQFSGTPRIGFEVRGMAELVERLRNVRLRCLYDSPETGGPFQVSGPAVYARDPGGNFLEFQEARS
jgi:catechol 2,3-dioxygenase-like lactoylglutathione lyase family enzyme